jgi:hypothetical protein
MNYTRVNHIQGPKGTGIVSTTVGVLDVVNWFTLFLHLHGIILCMQTVLAVLDEKKLLKVIRRSLPHCSKLGKSQKVQGMNSQKFSFGKPPQGGCVFENQFTLRLAHRMYLDFQILEIQMYPSKVLKDKENMVLLPVDSFLSPREQRCNRCSNTLVNTTQTERGVTSGVFDIVRTELISPRLVWFSGRLSRKD